MPLELQLPGPGLAVARYEVTPVVSAGGFQLTTIDEMPAWAVTPDGGPAGGGATLGLADGDAVGDADGDEVGDADGTADGEADGDGVGEGDAGAAARVTTTSAGSPGPTGFTARGNGAIQALAR
ncbi:hypothetical protein ACWT_3009 [Actinoplanes sp. SE50]|uniref:hypothetical protein n=1 Tax=unclassified Actinoplanes TaxID=2626549 RepID=UPI00023EBEFC|nr:MULTISPECIES: hypothetical protein [unclassified Actinoplanes]AEV84031.1 hypothetical protein ACPL_3136 [Actinoplanes sp. SE50/110]ATO82424.1 hypothetical protein ACWT_3009 [Actinoplanes sp. SE50]SLL99831.1 hypothetical protein ACSP50_3063 [Actinoplanes sp. SE50/110]